MIKSVIRNEIDVVFDVTSENERVTQFLAQKYDLDTKPSSVDAKPSADGTSGLHDTIQALRKRIDEKNKRIDDLCVLIESFEPIPGMNSVKFKSLVEGNQDDDTIDFRDSKIVSLAKKSHRLTMLLNKERAEKEEANRLIIQLKEESQKLQQMAANSHTESRKETKGYGRNEVAQNAQLDDQAANIKLASELKDAKRQIDELKRKLTQLSEENRSLTRALAREIGEGVTVEQAVDGGWRGRAQQIIMLKSKVSGDPFVEAQ